jgi:SAM-dependent methyltransferase
MRRGLPLAGGHLVAVLLVHLGGAVEGSEAELVFEALALREGMTVADVGAGEGEWTERLAREVGEAGHVYATEIDRVDLDRIATRVREAGISNVDTVLGSAQDTGLPVACCEAILLRLVYHHFTDPAGMRASLWRALRPGAHLLVVDFAPNPSWPAPEGVRERGGHGVREEDLVREMRGDGFQVVARTPLWNGHENRYGVVFRRPAGSFELPRLAPAP